ncbi:MAG: DUF1801 domain-containing protein [Bacteroidota bacterium]
MQYDVSTPEEYLDQLENDWRKETLLQLRDLISQHGLKEGIEYKMLSYADEKGAVFALNAQKAYTALYVGNASKVDPSGELLAGINHGKGCLRFKKTTDVASTRIEEFIQKAVEMRKLGKDIDC